MVLVLLSGSANAFLFDTVSLTGTQNSTQSETGGSTLLFMAIQSCGYSNTCETPLGKERYTKNSMRLSASRLGDDIFSKEFEFSLDISNDTMGLTDYTVSATYTWSFK